MLQGLLLLLLCQSKRKRETFSGMKLTPPPPRHSLAAFVFVLIVMTALISTRYGDADADILLSSSRTRTTPKNATKITEFPLNCSSPSNPYPSNAFSQYNEQIFSSTTSCPDYFRWIHEDLWPWRKTGITGEMVASAAVKAHFRLVILNGKAYLETYKRSFQSRDKFTVWGILQLMRRYPGRIPDLDLMFDCGDRPVIKKENDGEKTAPPLFRYCGDDSTVNVLFPDWSFWGWPEVNIKPWPALAAELKAANERRRWPEREPYAYWKGNPHVSSSRLDLLKCNISDKQDWNARVYAQDWKREIKEGFKKSDLSSQCNHRYKIYIEGAAWSVSEKYILACDSPTLLVKPSFFDFFTRSLIPLKHYWPVKSHGKCRSIKYAVEWGNSHQQEAEEIGKSGSSFVLDELKMDYVYDYMFHVLNEYAKLLKYKPTVPKGAVEVYAESIACSAKGLMKKFFNDTLVNHPIFMNPCAIPPPYSPASLHSVLDLQDEGVKQVEAWEDKYWQSHGNNV